VRFASRRVEPPSGGTEYNDFEIVKKDYEFLIGQRFSVEGEIYVVRDLTGDAEHTYVRAGCSGENQDPRTFSLHDVIQWLLVDEEIELSNPNYLAAR